MKVMINADDFGFNKSCTKAIINAFEKGVISTTTACANGEYFDEAVSLIKQIGFENAIGIHFNLTELKPLTEDILKFDDFCENGCFNHKFNRNKPLSKEKKEAVYKELTAQAERYKQKGLIIHHADSHHHIHNAPAIFPIYMRVIREQHIDKVRIFRNIGKISFAKRTIKGVYNLFLKRKGLSYTDKFGAFEDIVSADLNDSQAVELMVHPDFQEGILVDRDSNAEYDSPYGMSFDEIMKYFQEHDYMIKQI